MSILFDIALIIVLVVCALIGWKRGFVRSLRGFVAYILSFAVANTIYRFVAFYTIQIPLVKDMITDVEMPETAGNATFLDKIRGAVEYIAANAKLSNLDASAETAKKIINNYIAESIADILAFILVFFAALLILKVFLWILDQIATKTPVIRQANGLLGGIVGIFSGFFWTFVISNAFVNYLLPILQDKFPETFNSILVAGITESFVVRLCMTINPVTYLILLINLISN